MINLKLSGHEFSLVAQSILTRIDFVTYAISTLDKANVTIKERYEKELVSLNTLYDNLATKEELPKETEK